ncbi:hypothetical protein ABZ345_11275 [Lentzea sp. NPDC005914]|uniref:hypothetical protein n=1 Tax=Lentzea sp. NPDC005914 TaxID=3154572 RepID=UPI0033D5F1D5
MRTLIVLAAITVISGCAAAVQNDRPPDYTAPDKLVSCSVGLPQQWKDELARNQTEVGSHERVTIVGADENAETTLVRTKRNQTTELVLRDNDKRQQVMAVQGQAQIFGVEYDGRWVTFSTTPHPENHTVTTYAWDSRNDGAPVRIGGSVAVVHNGKAVWSDNKSIHVYDLAKKKDKVVGEGTSPALFGDAVIWVQQGKFGSETPLPEPLKDASAIASVASDGRTLVWTQGDDELHGWRSDWAAPRQLAEIKTAPMTEGIVFPRVSGDFVSWHSESAYVTDIRSGATMHTTDGAYLVEVRGGALTREGGQIVASAPLWSLSPLPKC